MKKSPLKELSELKATNPRKNSRSRRNSQIVKNLEEGALSPLMKKIVDDQKADRIKKENTKHLRNYNELQPLKPMTEENNLKQNCLIANKAIDYFKEGCECFFVLCRQNKMRTFTDIAINEIMQMIMRARFNSGKIQELLRLHWFDVKAESGEV